MREQDDTIDYEHVRYSFGEEGYRNASVYDEVRYLGRVNEYKQSVMANAYRKLIGPLTGKRILDVGCGTGRGVVEFANDAEYVVGVDSSPDMLAAASRKASTMSNCELIQAYAQKMPFEDASFDVVTSLNFLHLFKLDTQREMVSEMVRVAKPGGTIVLEFDNALHGVILGPCKRWLRRKDSGFFPGEIRYVIGDACHIEKVYGAVIPIFWRWFHYLPSLFVQVEKIAYIPPFNRFFFRLYYKLLKTNG